MSKFLKYILVLIILSLPVTFFVYKVLDKTFRSETAKITSQLSQDSKLLTSIFNRQVDQLKNDILKLSIPLKNKYRSTGQVKRFQESYKGITSINYFSADGHLIYSCPMANLEWNSNLLNRNWYRKLIKNWQPVLSELHQSPISPFPEVAALAVPVIIEKKINGFWLLYLDSSAFNNFFPSVENKLFDKNIIWFDAKGHIVYSVIPNHLSIKRNKNISENHWWHKINETGKTDTNTVKHLSIKEYDESLVFLFGSDKSDLGAYQVIVTQEYNNAYKSYFSLKSSIIFMAIIFQTILLILSIAVIKQWEERNKQLRLLEEQSLQQNETNRLVSLKNEDLEVENLKLSEQTSDLTNQRSKLLIANLNLERLELILNFLSAPVITLNDSLEVNYANKAAEADLGFSFEKISGIPFLDVLNMSGNPEIRTKFNKAKDSKKRFTFEANYTKLEQEKRYLISCDHLKLHGWSGYILTLADVSEMLQLQENIISQNNLLENEAKLTEYFLEIENDDAVINKALETIKEYSGAESVIYYKKRNGILHLDSKVQNKKNNISDTLEIDESLSGRAFLSKQTLLISDRSKLAPDDNIIEKDWAFDSAIFKPLLINNTAFGTLIITDPSKNTYKNYNKDLSLLLKNFDIGMGALMLHNEMKKKNMELEESTKFRENLLRYITHGMRTPLSTLSGNMKLLKIKFYKEIKNTPGLHTHLKKTELAADDLSDKILMYLDLARINRDELQFEPEKIQLSMFIEAFNVFISREARNRHLRLTKNINVFNDPTIVIDIKRYSFALSTILLNAIRFSSEKDNIKLDIGLNSSRLVINCEDHGPEIKSENIPLFGSEFLPEDVSKERLHYGDNFAIALAAKLIRLAQGQIKIFSNKDYTIHKVELPLQVEYDES
jgi:signal transduction histidine kinase